MIELSVRVRVEAIHGEEVVLQAYALQHDGTVINLGDPVVLEAGDELEVQLPMEVRMR